MANTMRRWLESAEEGRLAPYAVRSSNAGRRLPLEDEGRAFDYRTAFQRDRDRIVYSRAFRRLRHKAQVGLLPAYEDHRRNRLTHTLEVAQVARTVARALRLNEDLTEAVALGHDLGQPPFGDAGARALDDLMSGRRDGRGGPALGDLGGFAPRWQGLRVVDLLEKRYDHPGLNLTDAVREGILKSATEGRVPGEPPSGIRGGRPPLLETQVVALANRIATALHDLDDALQAGVVDVVEVERLRAVQALRRKLGGRWRSRAGRFVKANAIHRGLTHLLVTGAILESARRLDRWSASHAVDSHERFREVEDVAVSGDEIALDRAAETLLRGLEAFLEGTVHRGTEADRVETVGRRVVLGLFASWQVDPGLLDDHVLVRIKEVLDVPYWRDVSRQRRDVEGARLRGDGRFARILADHLAAMTDTYAVAEHARLLAMGAVPIPSVEQIRREDVP